MKKFFRFFFTALLSVVLLVAFAGCGKNKEPAPADPPSGETRVYWGTLFGTVTENGEGLEGVTVTSGEETATTDENGEYSIKVYSDGATVSFKKEGCFTQKKTFKSSSFYVDEIEYSFIMFISTTVEGTVVDGDGNAVEGALVTIGVQETETDSDGKFYFDKVIGTSMILTVTYGEKSARKALYTDEMRTGNVEVDIVLE